MKCVVMSRNLHIIKKINCDIRLQMEKYAVLNPKSAFLYVVPGGDLKTDQGKNVAIQKATIEIKKSIHLP